MTYPDNVIPFPNQSEDGGGEEINEPTPVLNLAEYQLRPDVLSEDYLDELFIHCFVAILPQALTEEQSEAVESLAMDFKQKAREISLDEATRATYREILKLFYRHDAT